MTFILAGAAILFLLATLLAWQLWRLLAPVPTPAFSAQWFEKLSVAKFRPMQRLLAEADFEFLARQPGISRQVVRKLRAGRRRVFRGYLHEVSRDFHRLHHTARLLLLASAEDRPELGVALARQRLIFSYALVAVEFRLALHAFGLAPVHVGGLVAALEGMRSQMALLVPSAAPAVS